MQQLLRAPLTGVIIGLLAWMIVVIAASEEGINASGVNERTSLIASQLANLQQGQVPPSNSSTSREEESLSSSQSFSFTSTSVDVLSSLRTILDDQNSDKALRPSYEGTKFSIIAPPEVSLSGVTQLPVWAMQMEPVSSEETEQTSGSLPQNQVPSTEVAPEQTTSTQPMEPQPPGPREQEQPEEITQDIEDLPQEFEDSSAVFPQPYEPRIQATPEIRETNAQLIRQLRELQGAGAVRSAAEEGQTGSTTSEPELDPSPLYFQRQMRKVMLEEKAAPDASEMPKVLVSTPRPEEPARTVAEDPLNQIVNLDFREAALSHVVSLLTAKAGVNVVAGAELKGTVTASLNQVPLRVAIETVLRMNNLGMYEENGIYFITSYKAAANANRKTVLIELEKVKESAVTKTLNAMCRARGDEAFGVSIYGIQESNTVSITAPDFLIDELVATAYQMDEARSRVDTTVTEIIEVHYADLQQIVAVVQKMLSGPLANVAADNEARHIVITDIPVVVEQAKELVRQLDVPAKYVTEVLTLNHAEMVDILPAVKGMLSERTGRVFGDDRGRQLVVMDIPPVVDRVKELVAKLDVASKQVLIETMVVDAILSDEADTGMQWLLNSLHRQSRRQAALGDAGRYIGNIQNLGLLSDMPVLQNPGSELTFSILTDNIDWTGIIQMEIRNRNGRLVSNPTLLTLDNKPANISIAQEIPYTELTQTAAGGQQTSTRFKEVGTVLTVTPKVTHENDIICIIEGKESTVTGSFQGVPIEDKREISSTMRLASGQTIFIGGLRKNNDTSSIKKIPVLGEVPVLNFVFRSNERKEQVNELLVFLTCRVIDENVPKLTPRQQEVLDSAPVENPSVDAWKTVVHDSVHPQDSKKVQIRWRRGK